jgi:hypothetical protein
MSASVLWPRCNVCLETSRTPFAEKGASPPETRLANPAPPVRGASFGASRTTRALPASWEQAWAFARLLSAGVARYAP